MKLQSIRPCFLAGWGENEISAAKHVDVCALPTIFWANAGYGSGLRTRLFLELHFVSCCVRYGAPAAAC